jgi:hypothetical protein
VASPIFNLKQDMERTAEQINKWIHMFTDVYDKDGKHYIPSDVKMNVWCYCETEEGFIENVTDKQIGIESLIAQKWILQSELDKLFEKLSN